MRRIAQFAAVTLVLSAFPACDTRDLVTPDPELIQPALSADVAEAQRTSLRPGTVLGVLDLPAPTSSSGFRVRAATEPIPASGWVRAHATGSISLSRNPEFFSTFCDDDPPPEFCHAPLAGRTLGPGGIHPDRVVADGWQVVVRGLVYTPIGALFSGGEGGTSGVIWVDAGERISAERGSSLGGRTCWWCDPRRIIDKYTAEGTHTVTFTAIEPVVAIEVKKKLDDPEELGFRLVRTSVQLRMNRQLYDPRWYFVAGDTAEQPEWPDSKYMTGRDDIWWCRGKHECTYRPAAGGRMYVKVSLRWHERYNGQTYVSYAPIGLAASPVVGVGRDSLVVEVVLDSDETRPVLDRQFNALTQYWSDADTPERSDVIPFEVHARWEPSGEPASGANVELLVEPVENSGGHPHGGRPPGTLFRVGEDVQKKRFTRDRLTLTLSEAGTAEGVYRTSGVSGLEKIIASVSTDGQHATDTATVTIRWPGLVKVLRSGATYYFEGESNSHYPHENYLAPGVMDVMESIWEDWIAAHKREPAVYPMAGNRFRVTGASTVWGGLYDYRQNWSNPHNTHRTGHDVDFNNNGGAELAVGQMAKFCSRPEYTFEGVQTICAYHNNHFHAFVGRTFYHR